MPLFTHTFILPAEFSRADFLDMALEAAKHYRDRYPRLVLVVSHSEISYHRYEVHLTVAGSRHQVTVDLHEDRVVMSGKLTPLQSLLAPMLRQKIDETVEQIIKSQT